MICVSNKLGGFDMSQVEVVDRDDEVLDYTQGVLRSLTEDILKKGIAEVGEDERKLLIVALKDQAMTAVQRKRIKVEQQAVNNQETAAGLIADLLKDRDAIRMFQAKDVTPRSAPKLGSEYADPVLVPGVTDINPPQLDVNSFMAATEGLTLEGDD
jgi:hypothetical protein